jgi:hypothetical protein
LTAAAVNNHQPRVAKVKVSNATPGPFPPKGHSFLEEALWRAGGVKGSLVQQFSFDKQ